MHLHVHEQPCASWGTFAQVRAKLLKTAENP